MMDEYPERTRIARMELPPLGNVVLGRVLLGSLYALLLLLTVLAVSYLARPTITPPLTLIASIVWLSVSIGIATLVIREPGGIRQFLIDRLGDFSGHHFLEVVECYGPLRQICFGYVMFRRDFRLLEFDANALVSVEWNTGQATALAGRDMDDWHVMFWYDDPQRSPELEFPGMRPEVPHSWGPSGPYETAEAFGLSVVRFLQQAGVQLEPTDDPTKFRVPSTNEF